MRSFGDLPFPVALALLGGATLAGVAALVALGLGPLSLAFLLVTGGLAAVYLHGYRARAPRPGPARSRPEAEPEESSDEEDDAWDPLIERDEDLPAGEAPPEGPAA